MKRLDLSRLPVCDASCHAFRSSALCRRSEWPRPHAGFIATAQFDGSTQAIGECQAGAALA